MQKPTVICKSLIELSVRIEASNSSSYLESLIWVEGGQGIRTEGTCPNCHKSFPIAISAVQSNSEIRCWHCHLPEEALNFLIESHPGLKEDLVRPAIDELLKSIKDQWSKLK